MREDGRTCKVRAHINDVFGMSGSAIEDDEPEALYGSIDAVFPYLKRGDEGFFLNFVLPERISSFAIESEDTSLRRDVKAVLMWNDGTCA